MSIYPTVLAETIKNKLIQWKIDEMIFCLTLGNCTTNDAMVRTLKNHLTKKKKDSIHLNGSLFLNLIE